MVAMTGTWAVRGRVVLGDHVEDDGLVVIRDGFIDEVAAGGSDIPVDSVVDVPEGGWLLPGLVDVHCHGGGGESFPNAETPEQARVAADEHLRHGTTSVVASLVTAAPDVLLARTGVLADLCDDGVLAGIHYEGPFISTARCGAQDPRYIVAPDAALTRQLLQAARGWAVSMTVAPEERGAYGAGSVGEALLDGGAIPSWGHTDSGPGPMREALAFSDGRATATHLFNGMKPLHHRDPGPIAELLSGAARGEVVLEMISDGVHLDPSIVRDVYETVGRERCVFVTDAMAAAGMADGSYQLGPAAVTVSGGVARLTDGGAIAGGTSHLLDCVRVAVQDAGVPLVDAVWMASAQGAGVLGRSDVGQVAAGARADLVAVDAALRPVQVWRAGEVVA